MQWDADTLLNLPGKVAFPRLQLTYFNEWLTNLRNFRFVMEIAKVTDRLRMGLSTAEKTGP
eukprot:6191381-Pleurochrysis_carterae.AAC.1